MNIKQYYTKLERNNRRAKHVVGNMVLEKVMPGVPIATGELRRSGRVINKGQDVLVSFGNNKTRDYTQMQYYENLRHLGARGHYQSIQDKYGSGSVAGATQSQRYWHAYRAARPFMQKSAALWFDLATKSKEFMKEIALVFMRVLKS